ncbi:MAG: hypothetical protein KDC90_00525 [Ignavibacteriae bacterium]|nr:hypothetical protein [Ignavibacteriota bacterium]
MEIKYGKQLKIEELRGIKFSLFLFAINHEKRMLTSYERLSEISTLEKVVGFNYPNGLQLDNESSIQQLLIENQEDINNFLIGFFEDKKGEGMNIVVDYSCMTKSWYYTIMLFLTRRKLSITGINVFFVYTPSKYSSPFPPKPNTEIAPLPGKYRVPTDKPKALIVCLGYEKNKAEGIIEHLDPKEKYILYSDPALDTEFVAKIVENNFEILSSYSDKVITFPLDNLLQIERELTALYYLLKEDYSIIIAPLGPKPFTLVSMLLSVKYKDIDIWRVGSGYNINEYDREPISKDTFILSKIVLGQELN